MPWAMVYVLHLEKCKMQKIKNHNIETEKYDYDYGNDKKQIGLLLS